MMRGFSSAAAISNRSIWRHAVLGVVSMACLLGWPSPGHAGSSDALPVEGLTAPDLPRPTHEIPKEYHGHWAYSQQNCAAGEPTAILSIDAKGLHQAEGEMIALGVLVTWGDRRAISISAHNSGGGGEWDSTEEFALSPDGSTIEWRTVRPDTRPLMSLHLYRCR